MKTYEFRLKFHWSLPLRRQAIIWINDGYFNDTYMRHSASVSLKNIWILIRTQRVLFHGNHMAANHHYLNQWRLSLLTHLQTAFVCQIPANIIWSMHNSIGAKQQHQAIMPGVIFTNHLQNIPICNRYFARCVTLKQLEQIFNQNFYGNILYLHMCWTKHWLLAILWHKACVIVACCFFSQDVCFALNGRRLGFVQIHQLYIVGLLAFFQL